MLGPAAGLEQTFSFSVHLFYESIGASEAFEQMRLVI
jgi:hypothetical protein